MKRCRYTRRNRQGPASEGESFALQRGGKAETASRVPSSVTMIPALRFELGSGYCRHTSDLWHMTSP